MSPRQGAPKDNMFPGIWLDRKKKFEGQASRVCLLLWLRQMSRYCRSWYGNAPLSSRRW